MPGELFYIEKNKSIVVYDAKKLTYKEIYNHLFDFKDSKVIQVGRALFCFKNIQTLLFTGLTSNLNVEEKAEHPCDPKSAALALYTDDYIFLVSAAAPARVQDPNARNFGYVSQVDYYSISEDSWGIAPNLNNERTGHSACSVGKSIYVFGGAGDYEHKHTMERLDADKTVNGVPSEW